MYPHPTVTCAGVIQVKLAIHKHIRTALMTASIQNTLTHSCECPSSQRGSESNSGWKLDASSLAGRGWRKLGGDGGVAKRQREGEEAAVKSEGGGAEEVPAYSNPALA